MVAGLPDCVTDILISPACASVEEFGDLVPVWSTWAGDMDDREKELAILGVVPVDRHDVGSGRFGWK